MFIQFFQFRGIHLVSVFGFEWKNYMQKHHCRFIKNEQNFSLWSWSSLKIVEESRAAFWTVIELGFCSWVLHSLGYYSFWRDFSMDAHVGQILSSRFFKKIKHLSRFKVCDNSLIKSRILRFAIFELAIYRLKTNQRKYLNYCVLKRGISLLSTYHRKSFHLQMIL